MGSGKKTVEEAWREARRSYEGLPLPWDPYTTFLSDWLRQLRWRFRKSKYPEGVMVLVWTPERWWGKVLSHLVTFPQKLQRRIRCALVTALYKELPLLYVKTLVKPDPQGIASHWGQLKACAEAERARQEMWRREMRSMPEFADIPLEEVASLEEDIREIWRRLQTSCYDLYLFPLRSRVRSHYWLVTLSANRGDERGSMSYAGTFIDEAKAKAHLGLGATLVMISNHGTLYWTVGTTLLDIQVGREWRILDRERSSMNILEDVATPVVEVEPGGGNPYPVLTLPIMLEELENRPKL